MDFGLMGRRVSEHRAEAFQQITKSAMLTLLKEVWEYGARESEKGREG